VVKVAILCPGQGAQTVGMGRDLATTFPAAQAIFDEADDVLGFRLSTLMWEGPEHELTLTKNAQPAILVHSLAAFAVLREALDPVVGAGHSLGEYSAYGAAGALCLSDAVQLVRRRGELMFEAGQQRPGTMAAVIGLDVEQVVVACRESSRNGSVVVAANINAPGQTVISGDPAGVEAAGGRLKELGAKRVLPLNVSGAFHSPLMAPAERGLILELDRATFCQPSFPIVANVSAEVVRDAETAKAQLSAQLTAPVRWVASMERAVEVSGVDVPFVEIGPGTVLGGLLRRIAKKATAIPLGTVQQITTFLEQHA
jgi:[acyl-carrier-protein] S-malonyltransferase